MIRNLLLAFLLPICKAISLQPGIYRVNSTIEAIRADFLTQLRHHENTRIIEIADQIPFVLTCPASDPWFTRLKHSFTKYLPKKLKKKSDKTKKAVEANLFNIAPTNTLWFYNFSLPLLAEKNKKNSRMSQLMDELVFKETKESDGGVYTCIYAHLEEGKYSNYTFFLDIVHNAQPDYFTLFSLIRLFAVFYSIVILLFLWRKSTYDTSIGRKRRLMANKIFRWLDLTMDNDLTIASPVRRESTRKKK